MTLRGASLCGVTVAPVTAWPPSYTVKLVLLRLVRTLLLMSTARRVNVMSGKWLESTLVTKYVFVAWAADGNGWYKRARSVPNRAAIRSSDLSGLGIRSLAGGGRRVPAPPAPGFARVPSRPRTAGPRRLRRGCVS